MNSWSKGRGLDSGKGGQGEAVTSPEGAADVFKSRTIELLICHVTVGRLNSTAEGLNTVPRPNLTLHTASRPRRP